MQKSNITKQKQDRNLQSYKNKCMRISEDPKQSRNGFISSLRDGPKQILMHTLLLTDLS